MSLLRLVYDREPLPTKKTGLSLEILGVIARQRLVKKEPSYSFIWKGVGSYAWVNSVSTEDFTDSFSERVIADQYRNTSGFYNPLWYIKKPYANHYTFGAVSSLKAITEWESKNNVRALVLGKQVADYPLDSEGYVKEEYIPLVQSIYDDLKERMLVSKDGGLISMVGVSSSNNNSTPSLLKCRMADRLDRAPCESNSSNSPNVRTRALKNGGGNG